MKKLGYKDLALFLDIAHRYFVLSLIRAIFLTRKKQKRREREKIIGSHWKHSVYAIGVYRARSKQVAMEQRDGNRAKSGTFDNYIVSHH